MNISTKGCYVFDYIVLNRYLENDLKFLKNNLVESNLIFAGVLPSGVKVILNNVYKLLFTFLRSGETKKEIFDNMLED
jgi:hypothetical protein